MSCKRRSRQILIVTLLSHEHFFTPHVTTFTTSSRRPVFVFASERLFSPSQNYVGHLYLHFRTSVWVQPEVEGSSRLFRRPFAHLRAPTDQHSLDFSRLSNCRHITTFLRLLFLQNADVATQPPPPPRRSRLKRWLGRVRATKLQKYHTRIINYVIHTPRRLTNRIAESNYWWHHVTTTRAYRSTLVLVHVSGSFTGFGNFHAPFDHGISLWNVVARERKNGSSPSRWVQRRSSRRVSSAWPNSIWRSIWTMIPVVLSTSPFSSIPSNPKHSRRISDFPPRRFHTPFRNTFSLHWTIFVYCITSTRSPRRANRFFRSPPSPEHIIIYFTIILHPWPKLGGISWNTQHGDAKNISLVGTPPLVPIFTSVIRLALEHYYYYVYKHKHTC